MTAHNSNYPSEVVVLSVQDALKADVTAWFGGVQAAVWFFSNDYAMLKKLGSHWGENAQFVPVGKQLNETALRHKSEFLNLDHFMRNPNSPDLDWLASDIAERSPYASTFLLSACRYMILHDGLSQGGKHIVLVDDLDFGLALYNSLRGSCTSAYWGAFGKRYKVADRLGTLKRRVTLWRTGLKVRAGGLLGGLRRLYNLRRLRKRFKLRLSMLQAADILMVIWARRDTFSGEGLLAEAPFYGEIPTVLMQNGQSVAYLVLPMYWLDDYCDIVEDALQADDPVVILEDTYSLTYLLSVAWSSLFQGRAIREKVLIGGYELAPVVAYEKSRERAAWRPAGARLFAQVGRFLAQHSIKPQAVLHLYENHSWEKCLQAGLREHQPDTRVLGCQQAPFSPLYLNFIPSHADVEAGHVPDGLLVSGQRFHREIERSGFPVQRIHTIGSFRYQSFLQHGDKGAKRHNHEEPLRILCATGSDVLDCVELVSKVVEAAARAPSLQVLVNFHPLTDRDFRDAVKLAVISKNENIAQVRFVETCVQELLNEVDVVCYSDTNSVFEALSKGVPVIHVNPVSGLDYDKAPAGSAASASSAQDLSMLFYRLVQGEQICDLGAIVESLIEDTLGPVNPDAMLRAVNNTNPNA
ncbi:MAG: hypothetical protein JKY27_00670 [Magnetovibrio sp.]|nr:hypothetical protein [Magnetovibrio sp.]